MSVSNDAVQILYQPYNIVGEKVDDVDEVPPRGIDSAGLQRILNNIATGIISMYDMTS